MRFDKPLDIRFVERCHLGQNVFAGTSCIEWTGGATKNGYGLFSLGARGTHVIAHRWAYQRLVGPIPEGLTIDHRCHNRRCVNPRHLRPLSRSENGRQNSFYLQTHCKHGHPFDKENTYVSKGPTSGKNCRTCRTCRRERMRRYSAAKRHDPNSGSETQKDWRPEDLR